MVFWTALFFVLGMAGLSGKRFLIGTAAVLALPFVAGLIMHGGVSPPAHLVAIAIVGQVIYGGVGWLAGAGIRRLRRWFREREDKLDALGPDKP